MLSLLCRDSVDEKPPDLQLAVSATFLCCVGARYRNVVLTQSSRRPLSLASFVALFVAASTAACSSLPRTLAYRAFSFRGIDAAELGAG